MAATDGSNGRIRTTHIIFIYIMEIFTTGGCGTTKVVRGVSYQWSAGEIPDGKR